MKRPLSQEPVYVQIQIQRKREKLEKLHERIATLMTQRVNEEEKLARLLELANRFDIKVEPATGQAR